MFVFVRANHNVKCVVSMAVIGHAGRGGVQHDRSGRLSVWQTHPGRSIQIKSQSNLQLERRYCAVALGTHLRSTVACTSLLDPRACIGLSNHETIIVHTPAALTTLQTHVHSIWWYLCLTENMCVFDDIQDQVQLSSRVLSCVHASVLFLSDRLASSMIAIDPTN